MDELRIAAGLDGGLRGEEADSPVPRRLDGGVGLGRGDADHGHGEPLLELGKRRGGGRVAGRNDELDPLRLEKAADLEGEPAQLLERTRAVRKPRMIAQVNEILVGQGDEALVQNGQPAHTRIEDADRPRIHRHCGDCRNGPGRVRSL